LPVLPRRLIAGFQTSTEGNRAGMRLSMFYSKSFIICSLSVAERVGFGPTPPSNSAPPP
jgi:hypothetical protein